KSAFFLGSHVGLVGLDPAAQPILGAVPEAGAHLVEQRPCGLVAGDPAIALKLERRDPLLVARHEEDRKEPDPQRDSGLVEDPSRGHGSLIATAPALLQTPPGDRVALAVRAARAPKPFRPA